MKRTKKTVVNHAELKVLLNQMGVVYKPKYKHEDYILSSLSLPYPVKNKLDRLAKKYNMSRSSFVAELIKGVK
jgi:hypothetical protein